MMRDIGEESNDSVGQCVSLFLVSAVLEKMAIKQLLLVAEFYC